MTLPIRTQTFHAADAAPAVADGGVTVQSDDHTETDSDADRETLEAIFDPTPVRIFASESGLGDYHLALDRRVIGVELRELDDAGFRVTYLPDDTDSPSFYVERR